jgi:hypothetical protein
LTEGEEKWLSFSLKSAGSEWTLVRYYFVSIIFPVSVLTSENSKILPVYMWAICFVTFIVLPTMAYIEVKYSKTRINLQKILLANLAVHIGFICAFFIFAQQDSHPLALFLVGFLQLIQLIFTFPLYLIWRKVVKSSEPQSMPLGSV